MSNNRQRHVRTSALILSVSCAVWQAADSSTVDGPGSEQVGGDADCASTIVGIAPAGEARAIPDMNVQVNTANVSPSTRSRITGFSRRICGSTCRHVRSGHELFHEPVDEKCDQSPKRKADHRVHTCMIVQFVALNKALG